jgi:hypothetical protein
MTGSFALAFWFIFAVGIGWFAKAMGRSAVVWTLFSVLCSPALGLLVVAMLDKKAPVPGLSPRTRFQRCAAWVKYVMPRARSVSADLRQV